MKNSIFYTVRNILLIFLAALLFGSCSLTKRRYMSGYSLDWGHKTPKTFANKIPDATRPVIAHNQLVKLPTNKVNQIPENDEKWTAPANINTLKTHVVGKETSNQSLPITKEPVSFAHTVMPIDTNNPHFFTGDEQGDDHARHSLTFGILSLAIPALAYIILFVIAISSGGTFTNPLTYAIIIFLLSLLAGLTFSVLAYIQGLMAIKEINSNPDIYEGKGQAVWGIILASILPVLIATYFIIRH